MKTRVVFHKGKYKPQVHEFFSGWYTLAKFVYGPNADAFIAMTRRLPMKDLEFDTLEEAKSELDRYVERRARDRIKPRVVWP